MAILIPAVFSDAVNAKLDTTLRIGRVAFDATSAVSDIIQYGNTIHFPKLNRVVTASEVTKGTALTPAAIDMTDTSATVKQVAASARVYDSEAAQIKGAVLDQMVAQVAEAMAKKIDSDLVTAVDTDATYKEAVAGAEAVTSTEMIGALGCFGDDVDTEALLVLLFTASFCPLS